eukprot:2478649-Pyramimonas_sp.AAC.1
MSEQCDEGLDDGGADVVVDHELPSTGLVDPPGERVRALIVGGAMSHPCPLNTRARQILWGEEHDGEFDGPCPRWIVTPPFLPPQSFLQMIELLRC